MYILAEGGNCAGQKQDPHPPARGHCQKIQVGVKVSSRGYLMIYRGPGSLVVVCLARHPPPPPSPVSKFDRRRRHTGRLRKRDNWLTGEGGRGLLEEPNHKTARKPAPL